MDENQKNDLGYLEKLAILSDSFLDLFPNGTSLVVFELDEDDYRKMQKHFRTIDGHHEQFTVEISGVDFHFMLRKAPSTTPLEGE
jgi:hypothetical protein